MFPTALEPRIHLSTQSCEPVEPIMKIVCMLRPLFRRAVWRAPMHSNLDWSNFRMISRFSLFTICKTGRSVKKMTKYPDIFKIVQSMFYQFANQNSAWSRTTFYENWANLVWRVTIDKRCRLFRLFSVLNSPSLIDCMYVKIIRYFFDQKRSNER